MYKNYKGGFVEIICGPMFSSKTETLVARVISLQYARKSIKVFKPRIDNRYSDSDIVSHTGVSVKAESVETSKDILNILFSELQQLPDVVVIDEVQFFDDGIIEVIQTLAGLGVRVIAAGLDQDYHGQPFRIVADLMAVSEIVTKLSAVCVVCGDAATMSHKISGGDDIIEIGETNMYEARCRLHHGGNYEED